LTYPVAMAIAKTTFRVVALLLLALAPAAAMSVVWPGAVATAALAVIGVAAITIAGGWRWGVVAAVIIAAATVMGVAWRTEPWAVAALMAALGAAYGFLASRGIGSSAMMVPAAVPFFIQSPPALLSSGQPEINSEYLAALFTVLTVTGIWTALLLTLLVTHGKTSLSGPTHTGMVVGYGLLLGITAGISAAVAIAHFSGDHWAWLTLTIFLLSDPTKRLDPIRLRDRLIGTAIGFGVALVLLELPIPQELMWVLLFSLMTAAIMVRVEHRPYWYYVALFTPLVILLESKGGNAQHVAAERLWFTVAGALVAVLAAILANLLFGRALSTRQKN